MTKEETDSVTPEPLGQRTSELAINENHQRAITAAFKYIDGLLVDVETTAVSASSPFSRFYPDLSPAQQGVLADYIARIRGQMLEVLRRLGVAPEPPRNPATWSIQTALSFARVSIQEISPGKLLGYGPLDEKTAAGLERLEADLDRTLRRLQALLAQNLGRDLAARLDRLEKTPVDLTLLRTLRRIIADRGLIEFQGALEALIEHLESKTFEIAFFGRVNSGKSSLLNTVLEFDALPVGVTPVTAVPTRVTWGERPVAEIRFADAPEEQISLDRLADYVSEGGNPGNRKHVVRATVRIPSSRLRSDVVFVDTPGVGSLATSGERESYAYLPRCDLGVLLLDASSAPAPEDLEILRLLYESGIGARVVISKADRISENDGARLQEYVRSQIAARLGLDLPVSLVSTVGPGVALARSWFEDEIAPLTAQARDRAESSARRKLASLREGVNAALRVALGAPSGRLSPATAARAVARVEELALEAEGAIQESSARCERLADDARILTRSALAVAAREYARPAAGEGSGIPLNEILEKVVRDTAQDVREQIQSELVGLRDRLRNLLVEMAEELPGAAARPEELTLELVTQPALSTPPQVAAADFKGPSWLRRFPRLLERRAYAELLARVDGSVSSEFWAFGKRLRDWLRSTTSALAARFAAQSEPLRAQARRSNELPEVADPNTLAADLREIEDAAQPESVVSAGS
jgi:GTP-binding protein EngB required for normal cell division